jgi:hypothetical protein
MTMAPGSLVVLPGLAHTTGASLVICKNFHCLFEAVRYKELASEARFIKWFAVLEEDGSLSCAIYQKFQATPRISKS